METEASRSVLEVQIAGVRKDVGEIKTAMRDLSEAITKLALVEERQSQTAGTLSRAFKAIEGLDTRVVKLETESIKAKGLTIWIDRAVTALAGAAGLMLLKAAGFPL